ncbi:alpha/beta hydrolase [Bernardetia sp. OM2101]|uniref:alpha/beta hydrolase n=1 Tax=Bernardetia sp. OM2101 TaxID=3344876 RepID=UPI0035CE9F48
MKNTFLTSFLILSLLTITFMFSNCASKKYENVAYLDKAVSEKTVKEPLPTLNIFSPKKLKKNLKKFNSKNEKLPVLVFVHGGNWNSGDKETYNFFGRNFAKKGIVTVVVGYTLSPKANYDDMAKQIAAAINWTKENIAEYNGNPDKIFLTGHSAGGHLIALSTMNPKYEVKDNTISGLILNDAAGLDMYNYLQKDPPTSNSNYDTTWTKDPETWKKASPIYYIDEQTSPIMLYLGKKTYESIKVSNRDFVDSLHQFQPNVEPILLNKSHIPMMVQYFFPWNNRYDEIIKFIKEN